MQDETVKTEEPISILNFTVQNVKRAVKVTVTPATTGITALEGNNRQGKTSALDAIAHAIFGASTTPKGTQLINDNAKVIDKRGVKAKTTVTLSNGTVIERKLTEKNNRTGNLSITLPSGESGDIESIKKCLSEKALCPPDMAGMTDRQRLVHFLDGLDIDITDLQEKYDEITANRKLLYIEKEKAQKHSDDLPSHDGLPPTEIVASQVMDELQKAMDANAKNNSMRNDVHTLVAKVDNAVELMSAKSRRIIELKVMLESAEKEESTAIADWKALDESLKRLDGEAKELVDIPTDELQQKLKDVEAMNIKIRENLTKAQKIEEADVVRKQWSAKEGEQNAVLREMKERISSADCPISSLSVNEDLQVVFDGQPWGGMSGMQKMVTEIAIASLYNKNARIVFADGLEALDNQSVLILDKWAKKRGLQLIATKVGTHTGDDGIVRVLIEDGHSVEKTEKGE